MDLTRRGNVVLIFPQGTHAHPEAERGDPPAVRFRAGTVHVADALDATVMPFGLAGTEVVMPAFLDDYHGMVIAGVPVSARRAPLALAFGEPTRRADDESVQAFAGRLERVCYALAAEVDAAIAPANPTAVSGGSA